MEDIIKDLNIVDFLGIIVPGSLLVLLITGDNTQLLLWADYFGPNASVWVRAAFLLIAGYMAGMILHEIGDLMEKGTWCFHALDPKAYAANAVGAEMIENGLVKTEFLDKDRHWQPFTYVFRPWIKGMLGLLTTIAVLGLATFGFCEAMDEACNLIKAAAIGTSAYNAVAAMAVALGLLVLVIACALICRYDRNPIQKIFAAWTLRKVCKLAVKYQETAKSSDDDWKAVAALAAKYTDPHTIPDQFENYNTKKWTKILELSKNGANNPFAAWEAIAEITISTRKAAPENAASRQKPNVGSWKTLHNVCVLNPTIQTYVTLRGIHSKQPMFDSFRHVMRNSIIAVAVVNLYSMWRPVEIYQDIAHYMTNHSASHTDFMWLCVGFAAVIIIMFCRYNHYVFLRYKYGYENFVEKAKTHGDPNDENVKTFRIHLLDSDPAQVEKTNSQIQNPKSEKMQNSN